MGLSQGARDDYLQVKRMTKRALICGISGQDGAYLARLLLNKDYEVHGISRDAEVNPFYNLEYLGIKDRIHLNSSLLTDFRSVISALMGVRPDEIYNLSGQSSVSRSFTYPVETLESIATATLNILEAIRMIEQGTRFYNACSSECFGDTEGKGANESTQFSPRSPYGVAKTAAFWEVANYREAYGLHASSGILFNHESPLRAGRFVTKKIVEAASRIAKGSREKLCLGDISVERDWGWAPDFVEAMWTMLQQDHADDYVIGTGESHSLEEFISEVFGMLNLDWHDYVEFDPSLRRPSEIPFSRADPQKARDKLGWVAENRMTDVVRRLIEAERGSSSV